MQVEVEKMKALGNLAATALDKTGALKAAGDFLFGTGSSSSGGASSKGAVGAAASVIKEAGKDVYNKVKEWVSGSSTGWTEIKPQGDTAGWSYYLGGNDTMAISDKGSVYINGSLVADDQLGYDFAGATDMSNLDSLFNFSGVSE
jgi:hypothetical protein